VVEQSLADPAAPQLRENEQRGQKPNVLPHPCGGVPDDSAGLLGHERTRAIVIEQVQMNALPVREITAGPTGTTTPEEVALSPLEDLELAWEVSRRRPSKDHLRDQFADPEHIALAVAEPGGALA
jgi:hypothetical protein